MSASDPMPTTGRLIIVLRAILDMDGRGEAINGASVTERAHLSRTTVDTLLARLEAHQWLTGDGTGRIGALRGYTFTDDGFSWACRVVGVGEGVADQKVWTLAELEAAYAAGKVSRAVIETVREELGEPDPGSTT